MKMRSMNRRTFFSRVLIGLLCMVMVLSVALPANASGAYWEDVSIKTKHGKVNTIALVLESPAKNCTSFDMDVEIEMNYNTKVKKWDIWIRSGGGFTNVGTLYLPDGAGSTTMTVELPYAKNFDAVAITPTVRGSYSWTQSMAVYNLKGSTASSNDSYDDGDYDDDDFFLPGEYEKVKISSGGSNFTVSALVLDTPLKKIKSFGLAINVEMLKNTHCKNWNVYIRTGGRFTKVGKIFLEDGDGYGETTVYLKSAKNFDAVAVIPTASGGYSWRMDIGIFDPQK